MSKSFTFLCAILGTEQTFQVELDETHTVYDLKKAIKAEKRQTLTTVEADTLKLYKVKLDVSNKEYYEHATKAIAEGLLASPMQELEYPFARLSEVFQDSDLPRLTIHLIVERPVGELPPEHLVL